MSDHTLTAVNGAPEMYVRVNVTKNTKGYSHESTVSIRWGNTSDTEADGESYLVVSPADEATAFPDDATVKPLLVALKDLLQIADIAAREEIARREAQDGAR